MKKTKLKKLDICLYIILAAVLVHIIYVFPSLPAKIPIHWNYKGEIDDWADKSMIFLLYVIPWAIHFLLIFAPKIDPKKNSYTKFKGFYDLFKWAVVLLLVGLIEITIILSFDPKAIKVEVLLPAMISMMFVFVGNYLPKCKQNYTFGIKTPWTLDNEIVWNKTHRFAGQIWVVAGILSLIISLWLKNLPILFGFIYSAIILTIVTVPMVYSYLIFQKEKNNEKLN